MWWKPPVVCTTFACPTVAPEQLKLELLEEAYSVRVSQLFPIISITQRKQEEEALKQQVQELQIDIDQAKLARQVSEIVQSDYFEQLKAEVELLRYRNGFDF